MGLSVGLPVGVIDGVEVGCCDVDGDHEGETVGLLVGNCDDVGAHVGLPVGGASLTHKT